MAARSTDTAKKKTAAELLREKKINTCQAQIAQAEEQIRLMTAEKAALTGENIIGLPVTHKQFGSGQVSEQDAITVSVCFESGTRRFPVPQAFLNGFWRPGTPPWRGALPGTVRSANRSRSRRRRSPPPITRSRC